MYFVPEDYIHNKAFDLPKEMQGDILYYFEKVQSACVRAWDAYYKAKKEGDGLKAESKFNCYKDFLNKLHGANEVLAYAGIKIEYDWPGYRGKWFFPTYEDALGYEDFLFQCAD